jgi:hypothetical protein
MVLLISSLQSVTVRIFRLLVIVLDYRGGRRQNLGRAEGNAYPGPAGAARTD